MTSALQTVANIASGGRFKPWNCPWWALRGPHATAIRAALLDGSRTPGSAARCASGLRAVLRVCVARGLMTAADCAACIDALRGIDACQPRGRPLDEQQVIRVIRTCRDGSIMGARDAAIITALWGGLTAAEVVRLNAGAWLADRSALRVTQVRAGRETHRFPGFSEAAAEILAEWAHLRGLRPGALFVPVHASDRLRNARLKAVTIRDVLDRRFRRVGLEPMRPRELRSGALALHAQRVGLATVRQMAGHTRMRTTACYLPPPSAVPAGSLVWTAQ